MKIKLTQSLITNDLQCPDGKLRIEYCDTEVPGLYVEVRATNQGTGTAYYRYKDIHGKTCHIKIAKLTDLSLSEIIKKARSLRAEITLGADPSGHKKMQRAVLTLDELWVEYEAFARPRKRSFKRDEQIFRLQIQPTFGKVRISQIARQQIQSLMAQHKLSGLSAASVDHVAKLIRRMLGLAVQWEMLEKNPASRIELFNEDNQVQNMINETQLQKLLAVLQTYPSRNVALICMFLLATGSRVNEALTAQWSLIDRQNRIWRVSASNSKSGKSRAVPLSDAALDVLDQIGTEGKFDYVFINQDTGKPYTHIRHTWIRIRNQAGMPWLRLHDLRHGFASLLVNAGCSLFIVQQALGHADSRVTQRYSHLSSKTLQDAANTASLKIKEAMKQVA